MKLKTVEVEGQVYAEIKDGKPVYVGDDGKEVAFDAAATTSTIERITDESKRFKERAQTAEGRLKDFEGIEDPAAAKDALAKLANFKDKDLIEAGKVEEIKAAAIKAKDEEYAPIKEERDTLKRQLHDEKIGGSFARSKFIQDKVAIPSDLIRAQFGSHFTIEEGKIVAKDASGNQIYSKASPGNPAPFEEALEILIDQYAYKDSILKGTGGSGTGKKPGEGGHGDGKTISRDDFNALGQADRAAKMKEGVKVVDAA